jgi:hypothetical protein
LKLYEELVLIFDFAFSSSANHNLLDSVFTLEDMLIVLLLVLSSIPLEKQFIAMSNPSQWPLMIVLYRMISYFSHQSPQNHYRESSKLTRLLTEWMIIVNNLSLKNGEISFIVGIHDQIIKEENSSLSSGVALSSSSSTYQGSIMKIICQELLKKGYLSSSSSSSSSATSAFLSFFSNCFLATLHQFHQILLHHLIQNVLSSPSIPSSISDELLQRQQTSSSSKPVNPLDQDLLETSNELLSSSSSSDQKLSKLKILIASAVSSTSVSSSSFSTSSSDNSSSLFSWNLYSNHSLSLFQRFHYFSCFHSIDDLYSFLKEYQQNDEEEKKEEGIVTKELLETLWKNDLTTLFEIVMFLLDDCYYFMKISSS